MIVQITGLIVLMCIQTELSPTHYTTGDGQIVRYSPRTIVANKEMETKRLVFTESPSGRLMYLEEADKACHPTTYEGIDKLSEEFIKHLPYEPEKKCLILHVCDAKGDDFCAIPIQQKYGTAFHAGRFYGERWVGIQSGSRYHNKTYELFIDLNSPQMFPLGKFGDFEGIFATVSPDGNTLLAQLDTLIYLNGTQIFPYYSEHPLDYSEPPEVFQTKKQEIKSWYDNHESGYRFHFPMSQKPFSPDSRYFALLTRGVPLRIVIVDTLEIGPNKTPTDYVVQEIPVNESAATIQSGIPSIQWSEDGDEVLLELERDKEFRRRYATDIQIME